MTRNRNMKLELADAEISACKYCGIWTTATLCSYCQYAYPTIDDLERETA